MLTQNITLCIGAGAHGKKVIVKCHDTGVNFFVRLEVFRHRQWRDVREPYAIPEGSTAIIKVAKPDNTFVLQDGEIIDNGIYFRMNEQTFTVSGTSRAEVSLYGENGRRITTASFIIEVDDECICDCEEESETYVDILAEQIQAATEAADKVAEDAAAGKFNGADGKDGKDGKDGEPGPQGEKGEKGDKGDKGDNYILTEEDKQTIVDDVLEEIGDISTKEAVLFTEQTLTDEQKEQARENIGASDSDLFENYTIPGKNFLNPTTVTLGKYIKPKTGALATGASYYTSDFIPVEVGKTYTLQARLYTKLLTIGFLAAFNANKEVIASAGVDTITQYTVPEGVAFIRFSNSNVNTVEAIANSHMFVASDVLTDFEPYTEGVKKTVLKPEHHNDEHIKALIEEQGVANTVDAYLPKHIYCAVGRTVELYNKQVCLQAEKLHMQWTCRIGKALKRKFSITGTDGLIGDYLLSLKIYNDNKDVVWEGSTTLHVVSNVISGSYSVCPIGDSLTNQKRWMPEIVNLSDEKISFVGSYSWGGKDADEENRHVGHEGRSGFSAASYIGGKPYTYGGGTETEHNIFWDGSRFNWSTYKTATGLVPDAVQIFLGTNGLADDNATNAGYIKQMVDYIRQDDASIPIFVVNTIYCGTQDGIGVQQNSDGYSTTSGKWKYNEDLKIMNLMQTLDALVDSYSGVYMINLALTHDSENNFGAVETPVNPRAAQKELMPVESIHPQTQGYFQMADVMFSVMASAFGG